MTVNKVLKMWQDKTGNYADFIDYILSAVIGKRKYRENKCVKLLSNYATVTDEAFGILVLENQYDHWVDMHNKGVFKESTVLPKYTNGGSSAVCSGKLKRYQGWSVEGINRFNEIFDMVTNDQKSENASTFEIHFQ